jgi:AcrR family transcriptional regulator
MKADTVSHKIDDAREQLLAESKKILVKEGFERLNIRTLVQRCGIATGTFYNNFSYTVEILKAE